MIARQIRGRSRTRIGSAQAGSCKRRDQEIVGGDKARRADEGDIEEQHQHRDAADDLDIEAGDLPQDEAVRKRQQRDAKTKQRRERKSDQRHEDGDADRR